MYIKQVMWYIKPPLTAYSLINVCTKNYWNRTTIVEIIVGGWVVSFFETQCIYTVSHKKEAT